MHVHLPPAAPSGCNWIDYVRRIGRWADKLSIPKQHGQGRSTGGMPVVGANEIPNVTIAKIPSPLGPLANPQRTNDLAPQ